MSRRSVETASLFSDYIENDTVANSKINVIKRDHYPQVDGRLGVLFGTRDNATVPSIGGHIVIGA